MKKINTTLTHDVHKRAAFLKIFYRRQSWACAFSLSFCFVLGFFFCFIREGFVHFWSFVLTHLSRIQAHLPEIKVHAYFAPVTPPPSVHGGGQRLCRCCIILWQWRARGGHLCLQVLLLWEGGWCRVGGVGWGNWGRHRGERGLDPLTAPDHWSKHWLIAADPWSVEPAPSLSSCSPISSAAAIRVTVWQGGGKNTDGRSFSLFLSLSRALFLIVKTRTGSPFHSALPHISDSPPAGVKDCIWTAAGGVGGWNGETTVLHVQTLKKKRKKDIFMLDTLCGEVSSQLITWHLYTTILWFILLRPIDAQHGGSGALHCG